jgi:hypothetical protein
MAALIVRLLCFGQQYQALKTRVKNNSNQGSLLKKEDKHTIHEATRNKHEVRSRDFRKTSCDFVDRALVVVFQIPEGNRLRLQLFVS